MGLSGASVVVSGEKVRKTGNGAREQGIYALELGVGPPIYQLLENGYVMQRAYTEPCSTMHPAAMFSMVIDVLKTRVWNSAQIDFRAWKDDFKDWALKQDLPSLVPMMEDLYRHEKVVHTRIQHRP
jgi:hypothetical protein